MFGKSLCPLENHHVAGVEPRLMGVGPVAAIPKVLAQTGLSKEDIDIWEVNK